jgi:phage terminase large subunit
VDFGYTNPAALLKIGVSDGKFYVLDEWYKTGRTTEQLIDAINQWKPDKVYPDPAEPDRIQSLNSHFNCLEVSKDIPAGIQKIRELLKGNKLFISLECKNLINEFETYHYPENSKEKNEPEKPEKDNDHALDALRYTLYSYRLKPKTEPIQYNWQSPNEFFASDQEEHNNEFLKQISNAKL